MPLVYDFKDIASRMKGELKQEPEPKLMPIPTEPSWRDMLLSRSFCARCNGSGVDPMHGGSCKYCYGKGVVP
jgi:DnaJ-class molecular chaperone